MRTLRSHGSRRPEVKLPGQVRLDMSWSETPIRVGDPEPTPHFGLPATPTPRTPLHARPWRTVLLGLFLVGAISYANYASHVEIGLAPFYFLPVGLVAWRAGVKSGIALAFLATVGWEISNQLNGIFRSGTWIQVINVTTHFAAYAAASVLISGQRREAERERTLSRMDALTGVANARAFYESAAAELSRAGRFGRPLAFVFLDVDDFKMVNDEMGHTAGDRLLVLLAQTMRKSTRSSDVVARLGGDEFGILFPELDPTSLHSAVRKIQAEIRLATLRFGRPVTVSMGALCCTNPPTSMDEMLHRADVLMYQAKAAGKNGVCFGVLAAGAPA